MLSTFLSQMSAAAFGTATSFIGSLFTRVTSFFTSMMGGLMNRIVSGFSALPGLVFGALGRLSDVVKGAMGAAASALKYAAQGIGGVFLGLAGAAGGLVAVMGKAIQTTSTWAKGVSTLSAMSGLSGGAAAGVQNRFGAVGLDASELMAGQNPLLYGMKASAFGIRGGYDSPNFLPNAASRFQSLNGQGGIMGPMMAQQMAKSLGLGDSASLRVLNTPVREIREQMRFSSSVHSGLGLNDAALVNVSRQWDQFTGKLKTLGESVLMKIAQQTLPRLNAGFSALLKFGESQAGGIGGLIERGVDAAFSAFGRLAQFLYKTGPEAVLGFTATFLKGLLFVSDAIPGVWQGLMKVVDIGQMGFDWLAKEGSAAFDILSHAFAGVSAGIGEFVKQLPDIEKTLSDVWAKIRDGINGLVPGLIPGGGTPSASGGAAGQSGESGIPGLPNPNASPYTSATGILGGLWNAGRALTSPGGWFGRQAAHAIGADAPWQQGAADLAGRYIGGRALLAGGRAALATPAGITTAAALATAGVVGYAGFSGAQALGLVDRDQSFGERLGLGASRVADFLTSNTGETDRRANEQWALDRTQAHGRATGHPMRGDYLGRFGKSAAAIRDAATKAYKSPGANPLGGMMGGLQGLLDKVPSGSWSQGLENRFGQGVKDFGANSSGAIGRALAAIEAAQKNVAGRPDNLEDLMKSLLGAAKGIEHNTNKHDARRLSQEQMDRFAHIVGGHVTGRARSEYVALVSR